MLRTETRIKIIIFSINEEGDLMEHMKIKAYDISDEYAEIELSVEQESNINNIFFEIVESHREKNFQLGVSCCLKPENRIEENALYNFSVNSNNEFDFSCFASALHNAEKTKDGSKRRQNIQEGFLFIKNENKELYLMKLEKIKDVDSCTFEIKGALGTDNNYYKLCIFNGDIDKVLIFDKNTRLASYWYDRFLGLTRIKDEYQNTSDLIDMIKDKKIFNNQLISEQHLPLVYSKVESYIFNNDNFQKLRLLEHLNASKIMDEEITEEFYSKDFNNIDAEFNISKKSIKDKYKKTIKISSETTISTDNFINLKMREGIRMNGNEIILVVEDDFINSVQEALK